MKKIIIIASGMVLSFAGFSQNGVTNGGGGAAVSSGVVDPTINGKPYSQYKAEQEALKKQKATPAQYNTSNSGVINYAGAEPARSVMSDPNRKPENGAPAPVVEAAVVRTEKPAAKSNITPDLSNPASMASVRGVTASNKPTATAGDAGLNLPSGAVNGAVPAEENKPAQQLKPASRTAAEIETAKKLEDVAKPADKTSNASAPPTMPNVAGLKMETGGPLPTAPAEAKSQPGASGNKQQ